MSAAQKGAGWSADGTDAPAEGAFSSLKIETAPSRSWLQFLKEMEDVERVLPVTIIPAPSVIIHSLADKPSVASSPASSSTSSSPFQDATSAWHKLTLSRRDSAANNLSYVSAVLGTNEGQSIGEKGSGVRLCTLDTGIDYTHPALGGCFGPACKVAFGTDLVGDAFDSSSSNPNMLVPVPDDDPMDCAGHGTHVAGIMAALDVESRGATGVAPAATVGAYRIFGCTGNTDSAIIVSALEQAIGDGCDVINMSLGGSSAWFDTPDSLVADYAASQGVIIVASAGNDQNLGLFQMSTPAVAKSVTAVGAIENTQYQGRTLSVVNDSRLIPFSYKIGSPPNPTLNGRLKASDPLNATASADGCTSFQPNNFAGFIALIRRGTCLFVTKINNAFAAGARGIIIYNKFPGSIGEIDSPISGFPVLTISGTDGEYLISRLIKDGNGNVSVLFAQKDSVFPVDGAGQVTDFSSWGPSPDLSVKPDIMAPGGHIFSTWPLKLGGYAVLSGTSMATPHVAGIYALVLAGRGQFTPRAQDVSRIKNLLLSTASPVTLFNTTETPYASVGLQGSGLVNASAAIETTAELSDTQLYAAATSWDANGEAPPQSYEVTLSNFSNETFTLYADVVEGLLVAADDPTTPLSFLPPTPLTDDSSWTVLTKVTVSPSQFVMGPFQKQVVNIEITGPSRRDLNGLVSIKANSYGREGVSGATLDSWLYSGFISFESCPNEPSTHRRVQISYTGIVGSFAKFAPLDTTRNLPALSTRLNPTINSTISHVTVTFDASAAASGGSSDSLLTNLYLLLPSPRTALNVVPAVAAQNKSAASEVLAAAFDAFAAGNGGVPGSAAFVDGLRLPISSTDPTNPAAAFVSLLWDGTADFRGGDPVPAGEYRMVAVVEGVYGTKGLVSGWMSDPFTVNRVG
ncbi:peptidase S8/S53 domain-containing protein [Zopfochytrium polystomum]|nr:peptidase S8/S53 domain-containing protein [Zopfochytrium polystomum]